MAVEVSSVRSRRALLVGAVGGMAALVGHAIGKPEAALGADVVLGGTNTTNATTTIQNTSNLATVLNVTSSKAVALAARGDAGALLVGRDSPGVTGIQLSGLGAARVSSERSGVVGRGEDSGVRGSSKNKVGVLGFAGGDGPSSMPPNAGVYGWSTGEGIAASFGVLGRSTAPLGYGVFGTSNTGTGVQGFTKNGNAVAATVTSGGNGRALAVSGRVLFSSSGIATVGAGNTQKLVDPGIALTNQSKVLATVMGNPGANVVLRRVIVDAATDKFTIVLSGAAANDSTVAWFVLD
jgi:hypothetical protein